MPGDVAVLVGLHARRAVATQPPSVLWVKLSGKCPIVQPRRPSWVLEVGPEHAGLDPREPGVLVDLEDLVHAAEVDGDDGALLLGQGVQAAGDVAAAAEGDEHEVGLAGQVDQGADVVLAARVDDRVGDAREVGGAQPEEVAQALAVRVHDPVEVVVGDVRRADRVGQAAADLVADARGGDVELLDRLRRLGRLRDVDPDGAADEGGEGGLVLPVEGDALDAPAPPLHVLDRRHGACLLAELGPR